MTISNKNKITTFFHCGKCGDECPTEPQDLEVGYTKIGFQVWCRRHNCNILHMDLEGTKHPANTTRPKE